MAVLVQFKLEGAEEARKELQKFQQQIKGTGDAANDAGSRGLANFGKKLNDVSARMKTAGENMTSFGRKMSLGVTLPIIAAGVAIFKFSSDAIESENLFKVSMGNMEKDATAFSKQLRAQLGLNEFEVRKSIGVFFQMTKSMGLSREASFSMSKGLTLLTQDMASFFNLKPEEAFQKLQAGITGEVEPLKRLGIIINETTIRQTALNAGLIKGNDVLSESQKVMARYLTIVKQTADAQGDLARTIDSPINKVRLLTAEFKQQVIELGFALMPTYERFLKNGVEPMIEGFAKMVQWFSDLKPGVQNIIIGFVGLLAIIGPLAIALGTLVGVTAVLIGPLGIAGLITMLSGTAFSAMAASVTGLVGTFIGVGTAMVAAFSAGAVAVLYVKNLLKPGNDFGTALEHTRNDLTDLFVIVGEKVSGSVDQIKKSINGVLQTTKTTIPPLESDFTNFADSVGDAMSDSAAVIGDAFEDTKLSLKGLDMEAIQFNIRQRERADELANISMEVNSSINDFNKFRAEKEIERIEDVYGLNREKLFEAMQLERARFEAMGTEGAEAVQLINEKMEDLAEQITDRTFGGGAMRALENYIDKSKDLGSGRGKSGRYGV
jgi:hypothetical protein